MTRLRNALLLLALSGLAAPALSAQPACNRACLEQWVDTYLDAAIARNPQAARLAPDGG